MNLSSDNILLLSSLVFPFAGAILLLVGGKRIQAPGVRLVSLISLTVPVICAFVLWCHFGAAEKLDGYAFWGNYRTGLEGLGISLKLGLNGISMPLFAMAAVVGLAAGWYALFYQRERQTLFMGLLLFMQTGLLGLFASVDIFFFYFFHELALIPTFIMIGIWGGPGRKSAAMEMTIYLTLGAMLSLLGLIALYVESGASEFSIIHLRMAIEQQGAIETLSQNRIFPLLLFGFGILVSLFPFHTWAPRGYAAAPTSISMLHAGVLKKFGLYGLVQIAWPLLPAGALAWSPILVWLALGSVILIGFVTIAQRDLKVMLGYSSVMHMGYCFLGIATVSVLGMSGVVLLMFAHGLTVALLFLLGDCVYRRTGTYDMQAMGGLAKASPVLTFFFCTAVMASIGLPGPGLINFWGELTIFMSLWGSELYWVAVVAIFGVVISAIYGLRAVANIFYGQPTEAFRPKLESGSIGDMRLPEKLPALLLLVFMVVVGFWPRFISDELNVTLQQLNQDAQFVIPATSTELEIDIVQ
jgi:NADH-quinone oxidoreductase subunit M